MSKLFIVDGYNIIYNWPELKLLSEESLEQAREQLVLMLNTFADFTGYEIRVVFDAHKVKKGKGSKKKVGKVLVVFTRYGLTADELIEKMINKETDLQVYVVTADETEQWVTFGRGAYRMTPSEFLKELISNQEKMEELYETPSENNRYLFQRLDSRIREILDRFRKGNKKDFDRD
ncbi:MAG: NYN domain-containing protein [Syntrophomonadaceae bacterium]|nr:NYN domain-containing protein [Syntrophomonadaceae bacterium]